VYGDPGMSPPEICLNLIRGLVHSGAVGDKLVALHKSAVFTFMNKNMP